jgi:outer membrane protein assembly factor BamB
MVVGSIGVQDPEKLLAFQGSDGTLLWSSERTGALAAYNEHVLIGNENTITSLAVSDGSMNWTASLAGARNTVSLMVYEDLLFVSATGSIPFFTLLPGNGEIIEKFYTVADFRNRYPAIPFYPDLPYSTVLANGVILQQIGNITYSVYVTDSATGQILWQSDSDIISNIAVMGNEVFMLTADSTLRLVDIRSGLTIESFLIQPGIDFYEPDHSVQHAGYYLCADTENQYLYVILGDSRQMISFRINQFTP